MTVWQAKQSKEKLDITPDDLEQIKALSYNIQDMLSKKAEQKDVQAIASLKTNKVDTEQCFRSLVQIRRMVENLAVLIAESLRQD